jgi:hypothetical protein
VLTAVKLSVKIDLSDLAGLSGLLPAAYAHATMEIRECEKKQG